MIFEVAIKLNKVNKKISEELFRQILTININYDSIDEVYYKGMSHLYSSWEITKGIRCFKRILEIGTDNIEILFNIGKILFNKQYVTTQAFHKWNAYVIIRTWSITPCQLTSAQIEAFLQASEFTSSLNK